MCKIEKVGFKHAKSKKFWIHLCGCSNKYKLARGKVDNFSPHHLPLWHVCIQCPHHFCNNCVVIIIFCWSPGIYALSSFLNMQDVYSRVDSYNDSTINLTSLKLMKNEVSLEIFNITIDTVYTRFKSNMKRTFLFLRRKYKKQFIVANKNKIIKKRNFPQLSAPLLKKCQKRSMMKLLIRNYTNSLLILLSLSFHFCFLLFFVGFVCGRNVGIG